MSDAEGRTRGRRGKRERRGRSPSRSPPSSKRSRSTSHLHTRSSSPSDESDDPHSDRQSRSSRAKGKAKRDDDDDDDDEEESSSRRARRARRRERRERRRLEKESRRKERAQRRLDRSRRRRRGTSASDERSGSPTPRPGPSRLPNPIFGDDLLSAERHEASLRDSSAWSVKLASLLADDVSGGFTEFGTSSRSTGYGGGGGEGMGFGGSSLDDALWEEEMRLAEASGPATQRIPKRWRDAAAGTVPRGHQGRGYDDLGSLNEEEYAEFIREGMYRRKHASELRAAEEAARRASKAEAERKAERERLRAEKARLLARDEREREGRVLRRARERWEERWKALTAPATSGVQRDEEGEIGFADIPWPVVDGSLSLDKGAIEHFLLSEIDADEASNEQKDASKPSTTSEPSTSRRLLRTALLRYHPDRFLSSRHFSRLKEGEKERVRQAVHQVSQVLSELVGERRPG